MAEKLSKQIIQMVEKGNVVLAIKTLSEEKSIDMGTAKELIDDYEQQLKLKQEKKLNAIAKKQGLNKLNRQDLNISTQGSNESSQNFLKSDNSINASLKQHLQKIGYKQPLIPYWLKRIFVISILMILLALLWIRFI